MSMKAAQKRYVLRIFVASVCYLVTLAVAIHFVRGGLVTGPPAYLLGVLPGLSVAGFFWAIGKAIAEERDEFLRMLLVRQTLVATGFTLTLVTIWSFLENLRLVDHVEGFYVAILWFIGLGVGAVANRITMGAESGL